MKSGFVKVTPEMAKKWLEQNNSNRTVRRRTVLTYASDMKNGRWDEKTTDSPIAIDTDGNLLNGQHRLYAIIEAEIAVTLYVIEGVSPEAKIFDNGATRSIKDLITLDGKHGVVSNATLSIARFAFKMAAEWNKPSAGQVEEFLEHNDNAAVIEDACQIAITGTHARILRRAETEFAIYEALKFGIPREELSDFARIANTGMYDGKDQTAPIVLRNAIFTKKYMSTFGKMQRALLASATEQAIADFHEHEPRQKSYVQMRETAIRKNFMEKEAEYIKSLI